jgi:hypothetical protein
VRVDWDPAAGDVEVTIDHGEGRGETVLHGGASGTIDDQGQLSWDAAADPEPVTHLSPEFQARIAQMIFGVWKDGDDTWMIRPPDGRMPGREVAELPEKAVEVAELRERISELRATRVHVWEGPGGGRVIQKEYKDLRSLGDYEYLRDESRAFNAEEIAALEARLAEMQAETGRGWFAGNDPLGMSRAARRTLRDVRDIAELPQEIINELVASWSPPEWIELAAV